MKTFMDGGIKVSVDSSYNLRWLSFAKQKLAGLDQSRELSGVPSLAQKHIPENGIIVHVRVTEDSKEIEIIRERVDGFLFHPRSGEIDWKAHTFWAGLAYRTVQFPYIKGSGWKPNGDPLLWSPVEYPLADGDKGTRNVRRRWSGSREWKYIKNPPENYGNLDWKGWNTAGPGSRPNNPVLTWKGPSSRYFAEGMEFPPTGEPYYTPNVYESGRALVSVPVSEEPAQYMGEPVPYVVLGAALARDAEDEMWLVVVAKEYYYNASTGESRNALRIAARKYKALDDKLNGWYHEEDNPEGWRILLDGGNFPAASPFHFNASGTEASSVHEWVIRTISVDINTLAAEMATVAAANNITGTGHLEGTGLMTGPHNGWDGAVYAASGEMADPYLGLVVDQNNNFVGSSDFYQGGYGTRTERSEAICAIDYKGDTKVEAKVVYTSSSKSESAIKVNNHASATTIPGTSTPTRGDFHSKNIGGGVNTYNCQIQLQLGSSARVDIYTDDIYTHHGVKGANDYTIVEWYGNLPSKVSGKGYRMDVDDEMRDIHAGVVMFLDLRHDIAVIAKRRIYSSITSHNDYYTWDYDTGGESIHMPDETSSDADYKTTMNIVGQGDDELPWYEQFVFTDDDENVTMQYPAWAIITDISTDYPVTSIHFRYSNQPVGSWAVDRHGNHFYSTLQKDGVYNYLTEGHPVALTKTPGDNPVFFPIAPV